jgi:GNAT superfamily N-acetyltransferase
VFAAFVAGALRYSASWIAAGDRAVAVWIPPGGVGLSPEQELAFEAELRDRLSPEDAERILEGLSQFEKLEPSAPHYYLSLLGTGPAYAGGGHGRDLLQHNLALIDAEGAAAYLDCVDARVRLYEGFGFEVIGSFMLPDGPRTNGMWRPAARIG